jgi:hypothetical protein
MVENADCRLHIMKPKKFSPQTGATDRYQVIVCAQRLHHPVIGVWWKFNVIPTVYIIKEPVMLQSVTKNQK